MGKKTAPQSERHSNGGNLPGPRSPTSSCGPEAIRYIGHKTNKRDTVAHSGTIWEGHNDVQVVPHDVAVKLKQFPSVWIDADKEVPSPTGDAGKSSEPMAKKIPSTVSYPDFSQLKDVVPSDIEGDSHLPRSEVIMGRMIDTAKELSQILMARKKRDRSDTPCASVSNEQCTADLLRKLYGYAAEFRGELIKEEGWQESPEWDDDLLANYLGIDLGDSVDIDDLDVGFSRLDLLELSKREATGLQVRIHSLAGGYFSSVAPLDPSRSPVSQLPVSCRQLCELDEDGYRAFRTNLSRLMLEVFSEEKLLEPEGCTRDIKSEILAWCKQKKSRIIGGPGSLESAEKYFKMFEKIRPNCETNEGAYDKIDSILDQDVKFNGREHNQSTVIRYIKEYKAAIEDLGF